MTGRQFAFGDPEWPGLAKLTEECGEVLQIVGKLMMVHGSPVHWSGDLRAQFCDELADLSAAVDFIKAFGVTQEEADRIEVREKEKLTKFIERHQHPENDVPPPLTA